jgi:hypothetical protein
VRGPGEQRGLAPAAAVDALLYGSSALFALRIADSEFVRNRLWADFALPSYALGATVSALLAAGLLRRRIDGARVAVAALVLAGAVAAPLAAEVRGRADSGAMYVASEVVVTECAAAAVAHGADPYSAPLDSAGCARSRHVVGHFPYLPGMTVFGLPRALLSSGLLTDARLFFLAVTLIATAAAFAFWRGPPGRRLRALQLLLVLPTGAAALVVGGDDLPVLALSVLALVLFARGRPAGSAAAVGTAALLKFTAWPLLLALATAAHARDRHRISPLALAPFAVLLCLLPAAAASPSAFADDVIMFPQGLASQRSPADSTTVGSLLVGATPYPRLTTWLLFVVALVVSAALLVRLARSGGNDPAAAAGAILLVLVLLAPVARSGYVVYPLELGAWSLLLRPRAHAHSTLTLVRAGEGLAQ